MIEVDCDPETREWTATIPVNHWDANGAFVVETRLPCRKRRTGREGVTISLPSGFTKADVEETIVDFFDGVVEVIVNE